jgi:hypothetical protein
MLAQLCRDLGAEDERGRRTINCAHDQEAGVLHCGRGGRLRTLEPAQMAMIMKRGRGTYTTWQLLRNPDATITVRGTGTVECDELRHEHA